jgi:pyrimidine-nucleoside phosphorylase
VNATTSGYVAAMDTESIGIAALLLGAGRFSAQDVIDYAVGIDCLKKVGDFVEVGQCLFRLYVNDQSRVEEVRRRLLTAVKLSAGRPQCPPLIAETLA